MMRHSDSHIALLTLWLRRLAWELMRIPRAMLPGSPAVEPTDHFVVGYAWTDYQRMTASLMALRRIATVWLLAYGERQRLGP